MYPITEQTLSFTTTAMPRPELARITYESFTRNMQDFNFKLATLYLNVDGFPDNPENEKRKEVADIARNYFGNVILSTPEAPNFASALKWCFSQVETIYNFHLEDDWELLSPIRVSSFNQFFISPHVQEVSLRAWKSAGNNFFLSPSFIRGSFCKTVAAKIVGSDNPEVQIRNMDHGFNNKSFLYFPFDRRNVILKDLGRPWMMSSKYDRGTQHFTQWSIREPGKGIQKLADQNAQIPKEFQPNQPTDKKVEGMNRWVRDYEKQRAIKLSRRGKII